jgi:hypothetical protein
MSKDQFTPLVFISYSHDSREHKQWVLEFAQELRSKHRVDVILDQWDLGHGDDMPRFMRDSVSRCDRILMICTDTYVEKADEGKGGVGYEAMIVDGELVRNLGTKKFVPVIRQHGGAIRLPKSVGTRLAANLSEGANREDEMKSLVEDLHQIPPPTKPPLGGGPVFAPVVAPSLPPSAYPKDPSQLYDMALNLARTGDLVTWRRLITEKKSEVSISLGEWRAKWEGQVEQIKDNWIEFNKEGLNALDPLYAVASAGIESGVDKFNRQSGLAHDILEPREWQYSGYTVICDFPQTAIFTFQALVGLFAVHSEQPQLVFELANQRLKRKHTNQSSLLWESPAYVGWPESLAGNCNNAWRFIWSVSEHLPWVAEKLGGGGHVRECLCGHFFLMSFVEFIERVRSEPDRLNSNDPHLSIPTYFIIQSELAPAIRSILLEKEHLLKYAERQGVCSDVLRENWPKWVKQCQTFLSRVNSGGMHDYWVGDEYQHFMEDLLR